MVGWGKYDVVDLLPSKGGLDIGNVWECVGQEKGKESWSRWRHLLKNLNDSSFESSPVWPDLAIFEIS